MLWKCNSLRKWWITGNGYKKKQKTPLSSLKPTVYHVGCACTSYSVGSGQRKWAWAPQGRDYSNDFESSLVRCNFWPLILFSKSLQERHTHMHGQAHTHLEVQAHILSTQALIDLTHKLTWVKRCRITRKRQHNRSSPALPLAPSKAWKNSDHQSALFLSVNWRTATWLNIMLQLAVSPHSTSIPYECINGKSINLSLTWAHCALVPQT